MKRLLSGGVCLERERDRFLVPSIMIRAKLEIRVNRGKKDELSYKVKRVNRDNRGNRAYVETRRGSPR